jgi:hypothetical protein
VRRWPGVARGQARPRGEPIWFSSWQVREVRSSHSGVAGATGFAGLATVSDLRAPGADPVATARQLLGLVTTGALAGDECRLRGEALRRLFAASPSSTVARFRHPRSIHGERFGSSLNVAVHSWLRFQRVRLGETANGGIGCVMMSG